MLLICMEESFGDKSCIHFKIEVLARRIEERGKIDLTASPLLERSHHQMPQCSKMPSHHAMNHGRIHQLHHLSGPHRGFSQVTYESESDSDKRDWGGGASTPNQMQPMQLFFGPPCQTTETPHQRLHNAWCTVHHWEN